MRHVIVTWLVVALAVVAQPARAASFDHEYRHYARLLAAHVRQGRVDYRALVADRAALDAVVRQLGDVTADDERAWTRAEQIAYWVNAYNVFTLATIVQRYPIQGAWLSLSPRNSIRQIDGAWTRKDWAAAGARRSLDDIEHGIIRPRFSEPLVHAALNCASVSCPLLAPEPYRAATLDGQLEAAMRQYLASPLGLVAAPGQLRVSSIFDWYGDDFVARYAPKDTPAGQARAGAVREVVRRYGPPAAVPVATAPGVSVRFLSYDWSLNDVTSLPPPRR